MTTCSWPNLFAPGFCATVARDKVFAGVDFELFYMQNRHRLPIKAN
jgi:hypothetical protein